MSPKHFAITLFLAASAGIVAMFWLGGDWYWAGWFGVLIPVVGWHHRGWLLGLVRKKRLGSPSP